MRRRLLGDKHPSVAVSLTGLANILVESGRFDEALRTATEAQAACASAFSDAHWRTAVASGTVGGALTGLGRFDEAEPILVGSFKALQSEKGAAMHMEDARRRLVNLYEAWNKPASALPYRSTPGAGKGDGK